MIDKQINGSQFEDGNPLNTSMNRDTTFDFQKGVEMARDEMLHTINKHVDSLEDIMLDAGIELQDKYYFKSGFMRLVEMLREDLAR